MANTFYPKGKTKILTAKIDFETATIKAALVKNTYAFDAGHEFLSALSGHVIDAQELTGKTVVDGAFDANDVSFPALAAGNTVRAVVLYKDTGVAGTSALIGYLDDIPGLPAQTSGGDIKITWSNGADKVLAI